MSINEYKDPEDISDIISKLESEDFVKEEYLREIVDSIFPGWILYFLDNYCEDYPHLISNWEIMMQKYNMTKGKIIIVDYFKVDDHHKLIQLFAELYTRMGYVLRTKDELKSCQICASAIPNEDMYNRMKVAKLKVPDTWLECCYKCKDHLYF